MRTIFGWAFVIAMILFCGAIGVLVAFVRGAHAVDGES
jgi:hypothetical protein